MYSSLHKIDMVLRDTATGGRVLVQTDHRTAQECLDAEEISTIFALARVLNARRSAVRGEPAPIVRYVACNTPPPFLHEAIAAAGGAVEVDDAPLPFRGHPTNPADLADRALGRLASRIAARDGRSLGTEALAWLEQTAAAQAPGRDEDETGYWTSVVELAAVGGEWLRAAAGGRWILDVRGMSTVPFVFQAADGAVHDVAGKAERFLDDGARGTLRDMLKVADVSAPSDGGVMPAHPAAVAGGPWPLPGPGSLPPTAFHMPGPAYAPFVPGTRGAWPQPASVAPSSRPSCLTLVVLGGIPALVLMLCLGLALEHYRSTNGRWPWIPVDTAVLQIQPLAESSTSRIDASVIQEAVKVLNLRVRRYGGAVKPDPCHENRLLLEVPRDGRHPWAWWEERVTKRGVLEFKERVRESSGGKEVWVTALDGGIIKSTDFASARARWSVRFELTNAGRRQFATLTTRLVGKPLGIFIDGVCLSEVEVKEPITDGSVEIAPIASLDEAVTLADQLNSHPTPANVKVLSPPGSPPPQDPTPTSGSPAAR